ncbi:MAG: FMN-binding negative transcriptional regulator [Verrucomicrobiaceae bacterium]|nr:FMN-binding negative transcriptional regulator [Verrucomicrobiaceae bacterium]
MYIPPNNQGPTDAGEVSAFMRRHSFATLVTHDGQAPFATSVPVLIHEGGGAHGTIVAHIARANAQWRHFASGEQVLVIFHGPHAYISPSWYETQPAVPTWNYAAVHAYGVPQIITDHDRVVAMLHELVEAHEAGRENRWAGEMPAEYRDKLVAGIVGFEIPITRLETKYKLSQGRSAADVKGVIAALSASSDQTEREVAEMMAEVHQRLQ